MANLKQYNVYINGLGQLVERECPNGKWVKFADTAEGVRERAPNTQSLAIALLNEAKEYSKQVGNLESDSHFLKYITERWRSATGKR